ncbi:MAG: MlaE family lipid ABC transporter permease subunit [Pseudomonadota bacterium]
MTDINPSAQLMPDTGASTGHSGQARSSALPPKFDLVHDADQASARIRVSGLWTIDQANDGLALLRTCSVPNGVKDVIVDFNSIAEFDTSGAFILHRFKKTLEAAGHQTTLEGVSEGLQTLLAEVETCDEMAGVDTKKQPTLIDGLAEIGESTERAGIDIADSLSVLGRIIAGFGRSFLDPRHFRVTAIVHHIEYTGMRAVPIIALMSFLIGAIIAQQGAFQLRAFGGEIFVVDLVGILVLREIGVLLTAIMVAGRSGSAFTAEIGSMKMREEIDALRIIGLDPIGVLALPRVIALMIALPLLTFISALMCILGAMVVAMMYSGIQPSIFASRLQEAVAFTDIIVGFVKAPFMALVIGLVACVEGLRVEGSTESLGKQTTASVVKSIFMVIVMDGIFAIYFASIGW